jgi:hypothetical protein
MQQGAAENGLTSSRMACTVNQMRDLLVRLNNRVGGGSCSTQRGDGKCQQNICRNNLKIIGHLLDLAKSLSETIILICIYDRRCTYNTESRSRNHYGHGNTISIIYSECVFADLVIQYSMRLYGITLYHLWPVCLYNILPHNFINGEIFFWGGGYLNTKCVF